MNKIVGILVGSLFTFTAASAFAADMSRYYEKGPVPKRMQKNEKPSELYEGTKEYVREKTNKAKKDVQKASGDVKTRPKTKTPVKVKKSAPK